MTRRLQRFLALLLLVSPSTLFALGLGDIQLHSGLNEPLDADIELISAAPDELSSLRATIANRETFERYGLERPASLQNLEFRVTRSGEGRNVLKVRSREPITEPFVSFLVEVNWSRGRLLREYTLLMDPPIYMPGGEQVASAPVSAPQAGATEADRSGQVQRPVEAPPPPAETPAVSRPSSPATVAPATIDGSSYTVRSNDTLWQIASSLKPGEASGINRMMMALYRANPDAFAGNINQLRAGAILRIPGDTEYEAIGSGEANAEVRRQYSEWRTSRGLVAEGGAPAEARLRLVTPTEGGEGTAAATSPGAAAESQQLRDRVRQLETQLDDSRRMIEVKDQELANLQRQLGQPAEPAATTTPPAVEETPPTTEPQAVTPETTTPEASQAPVEEPAPTPAAEPEPAPPPTAQPTPAAAAPEKTSWIDLLLANWYYAGAALLVLGLILFALTRRRQEPDFGNFGKLADAARSSGGGAGTVVAREPRIEREPVTTPLRAKAIDEAFLVEESGEHVQPKFKPVAEPVRAEKAPAPARGKSADDTLSSETAINLDQGDPLAEADFHMAYGLYDQAADLVRIAIEREPQRRDLRLKLLEIYFVWGNKDSFLQQARELAETRSQAAPGEWDKIAIMGRQISPDDPMFGQGAAPGGGAADVDLNLEGGENRVDLDLLGAPEGEHAGAIDLDLGHEDSATTGESPALREGEVGLDFVIEKPGRGSDGSATTREMTARTMETPTIETEAYPGGRDSPTIESPSIRQRESTTIREKLSAAMRESVSSDQTAELALDDLGLELDQLPDGEQGLEETDHPADAPTMLAGLDDKSRRTLDDIDTRSRSSRDEPTLRSKTLTGEEKISPTGTWVLDDKTLAATMALPGADRGESTTTRTRALGSAAAAAGDGASDTARRRKMDAESTAELAGLSAEEMDLDLDRLEAALQSDTIKHPRKGSTAEHKFSDDVFSTDTATDLDLDVGEVKGDRDREPTSTARIPADEMGLPELEPVTMSEVGTKLDLARAYMDMGDPEGARSILDEVLQEGSATQKQEAQRLIDSLPG
jgi:pilus assembly protein FimV